MSLSNFNKNISEKIYLPNFMSLPRQIDSQKHNIFQKQQQQGQLIQQKKRIDKILSSVIKQRMFGDIILKKFKDQQVKNYQTMSTTRNQTINLQNSQNSLFSRKTKEKFKSCSSIDYCKKLKQLQLMKNTLDDSLCSSRTRSKPQNKLPKIVLINKDQTIKKRTKSLDLHNQNINQRKKSIDSKQQNQMNKGISPQNSHKRKNYPEIFRKICQNYSTSIIYDIRISLNKFLKKLSYISNIPFKLYQRLFQYFCISSSSSSFITFKSYLSLIQSISSTSLNLINFLVFQYIDESKNGFITLQDLFKLMKIFYRNQQVQQQIYWLKGEVQNVQRKIQQKNQKDKYIKLTTQEILITNHHIILTQLKSLLDKNMKSMEKHSTTHPKRTTYNRSILMLEHDTNERLKINQIQQEQYQRKLNKINKTINKNLQDNKSTLRLSQSPDKNYVIQQGMRFKQFNQLFSDRYPIIFKVLIERLTEL